jgi:hypothetical protein
MFLTARLVVDFCQQGKVIHNGGDAERIRTQDEGSGSARRRRPQDVRMTRVLETFQRKRK